MTLMLQVQEFETPGLSCRPVRKICIENPRLSDPLYCMDETRNPIAPKSNQRMGAPIATSEQKPSIIRVSAPSISFDSVLFDDDPEFLVEIVSLFLATCPELLSAIEEAVLRYDAAGLCRAAHTMKGAVANFGAAAVVEQARALEMAGKDGDLSSAGEGCRSLRALMDQLVPELEAALKEAKQEQVMK
jgi:HPt (histidine-containing phosphotransfer) domain-containing protein